jgi:PAS domain-containing protein
MTKTPSSDASNLLTSLDTKLIDLLPAAAYICEAPSGAIVRFNQRAAEMWGRTPVIGDPNELFCGCYRVYLPDGEPIAPADTPMAKVLKTGESVRERDAVVERPDGSRINVLVNIDPIHDAEGNLIGAINVFVDVTDHRRVEKALHQSDLWFRGLLENLPAIPTVL